MGDPATVRDKVAEYQDRLGMTHMIATRLRLPGIPEEVVRGSVALLAETLID